MLTNNHRTRRCSLCRSASHDIRNCNDISIREFHRTLRFNSHYISRYSRNGVPLILFYIYLRDLEEKNLNNVPYKQFLMNKGIHSRKLSNIIETRRQLVKYYFMPEVSDEEYKMNETTQKNTYHNLTHEQRSHSLQIIREIIEEHLFDNNPDNLYTNTSMHYETQQLNQLDTGFYHMQTLKYKPQIILSLEQINYFECCICFNNDEMVKFDCKHDVCKNCTKELINRNNLSCPLCRKKITNIDVSTLDTYNLLHT